MAKELKDLTEKELREALKVFESIDTKTARLLRQDINDEILRRKEDEEKKIQAAKQEQEKKEMAKIEKKFSEANNRFEMQKKVLGKYFVKLEEHTVFAYEVCGVKDDMAYVNLIAINQCLHPKACSSYQGKITIEINTLLEYKEISQKEYGEYLKQANSIMKNRDESFDEFNKNMKKFDESIKKFEKKFPFGFGNDIFKKYHFPDDYFDQVLRKLRF